MTEWTTADIKRVSVLFYDDTFLVTEPRFLDMLLEEFERYTSLWFKRDRLLRIVSNDGNDIYFPISTVSSIVVFIGEEEDEGTDF